MGPSDLHDLAYIRMEESIQTGLRMQRVAAALRRDREPLRGRLARLLVRAALHLDPATTATAVTVAGTA